MLCWQLEVLGSDIASVFACNQDYAWAWKVERSVTCYATVANQVVWCMQVRTKAGQLLAKFPMTSCTRPVMRGGGPSLPGSMPASLGKLPRLRSLPQEGVLTHKKT